MKEKELYYLINKKNGVARRGAVADVIVVSMTGAVKAMMLDIAEIEHGVYSYGRCDTDTHILVPVDGIS